MKKLHITLVTACLLVLFLGTNILFDTGLGQYITTHIILQNELTKDESNWLAEHGSLIYGADENSPPLMYIDSETGQYKGFTIDYTNALSLELGADIKHKSYIWDVALEKLKDGQTDICDMFPSKERERIYDFSNPIYSLRSVIVVSNDNKTINKSSDLEGKTIAIPKGDFGIEYLNSTHTDISFIFTDNIEDAIQELIQGNVDAILGDEPVITYYIQKHNLYENLNILDEIIYESDVVLAVKKGNKILINILNKGIKKVNSKNTTKKIQQKWFGFSNNLTKETLDTKIFILGIFSFIVLLISIWFSYVWNKSLKEQVLRRTKELNTSKDELQIAFNSITNFIIVIANDLSVVNVNLSLLDFLNINHDDILDKNIFSISNLQFLNPISNEIANVFKTQQRITKELKFENNTYEIKVFPFIKNDAPLGKVIIMIEDVTKAKLFDNQVLHSSKMAAIGQLAAGVAHEIRNPLGLIRNYNYILHKKIKSEDELVNQAISTIGESVEVTSDIIDNLLNFSRIFDDKCQVTNIYNLVESITSLEKGFMKKRNITCVINCDKSTDLFINRESFKHIIINLIGNAVDAMPDGGHLNLTFTKNKSNFVFSCEDTGIGINESDIQMIFNPFYTKKVSAKGTGLGLYVVYNEITRHGGTINVSSKINEGTKFLINLPLSK